MRSLTRPLPFLLAAIFSLPLMAQNKPDLSGTWKQKVEQAKEGEQPLKPIVFKIEHKGSAFKYTASGETSEAGPFTETAEFKIDGNEHPGPGPTKVVARWEGQALVIVYTINGAQIQTLKFRASGKRWEMLRELTVPDRDPIHELYVKE